MILNIHYSTGWRGFLPLISGFTADKIRFLPIIRHLFQNKRCKKIYTGENWCYNESDTDRNLPNQELP